MVTPRVSNHRIAANDNNECKLYYGSTKIYERKHKTNEANSPADERAHSELSLSTKNGENDTTAVELFFLQGLHLREKCLFVCLLTIIQYNKMNDNNISLSKMNIVYGTKAMSTHRCLHCIIL
jgi:hypothetical protein